MMKPGIPLRQRDLVLVPIPFTDMASNKMHGKTEDAIVVGVTSDVQRKMYSVPLMKADMEEGELLRESEIRADKIYAVSQGIAVKKFGRIKEDVFREIIKRINALLEARQFRSTSSIRHNREGKENH